MLNSPLINRFFLEKGRGSPLPRTPRERAEDAQVEFVSAYIAAELDQSKIESTLLSMISTAEIVANGDSRGIAINRGHTGFSEKYPKKWADMKRDVWRMALEHVPLPILFRLLGCVFGNERFQFLSLPELLRRVEKMRDKAE